MIRASAIAALQRINGRPIFGIQCMWRPGAYPGRCFFLQAARAACASDPIDLKKNLPLMTSFHGLAAMVDAPIAFADCDDERASETRI